MAKDSMIGIVNELISKRLKSLTMTDVVVGTITSITPYSITILKELNEITIPEELIDIDTIPKNAKVGDEFRFLRYKDGSRFLALPTGNSSGGSEGGTYDYEELINLPSLNNIELHGNRNVAEEPITNTELDSLLK